MYKISDNLSLNLAKRLFTQTLTLDSLLSARKILLLLFSLIQTFLYAQINDMDANKVCIDDNWRFSLGDQMEAYQVNFEDSKWRELTLPHDWSIEGNVNQINPSGNDGGYFPTGIGWYRKKIAIGKQDQEKKIVLYFEGAYMNSEVYVNGKLAGGRPYGYSSFEVDITPFVVFGKENTIAVKVDNSQQKNSRWYSGSGIYRHVYLVTKSALNFATWGTYITTPQASKEQADIQISTKLKNESHVERSIQLTYEILDANDQPVAKKEETLKIGKGTDAVKNINIPIKNIQLWSPETPALYKARLSITQNNKTIDKLTVPFGIRTISYSAEGGFLLNGKSIKLNGGCVHHDNGALGAAAYDRAEFRKVEILKAAGFNAVRTAHNLPSEAFLDACDQLGMLVIDESFDGWRTGKNTFDYATLFDKWWVKDVACMVLRDRNHPSIIMWSTGNEIIERKEAQAVETAQKLAEHVKSLDPSRPVTSAITTWDNDWEIFDPLFAAHDIGGYNYQLHRAISDHERVPSRVIVQTESYPRDAFANWKMVSKNNYIIGDFVWTAMDYLGESGIGRYFYKGETEGQHYDRDMFPWHGAYCGDIDLIGNRKPISHYRDLLYNEDKKLYLAVREPNNYFGEIKETLWSVWPTWESWTWPGHEGKEIDVDIYSRYPTVRLYIDEKLVGEKSVSIDTEFKASFTIPYQQGTLRAVGMLGDKEKEVKILKTAGSMTNITMQADRSIIKADGQDLSFISIELTDANGILAPNAANKLSFAIEGPGSIIAVDNANLQDQDNYTKMERKAWKGKALIIVKSGSKAGNIRVTATSENLQSSSIEIKAE